MWSTCVPSGKRPEQTFVYTQPGRPRGPPVDLIWRVREHDRKFKILDISVQGVSMTVTLRDEYRSVAKRLGGVGPLVQTLRKKLGEEAYAPNPWASPRPPQRPGKIAEP